MGKEEGDGHVNLGQDGYYKGQWKQGKIEGLGERLLKGDLYIGTFVNGSPHGKGIITYQNKSVYDGQWDAGKPQGQGEKTDSNGISLYKGMWMNGS